MGVLCQLSRDPLVGQPKADSGEEASVAVGLGVTRHLSRGEVRPANEGCFEGSNRVFGMVE